MMRAARRTFSEMKPRTRFVIKTFNKISPQGLERFRPEMYRIKPGEDQPPVAHAIDAAPARRRGGAAL